MTVIIFNCSFPGTFCLLADLDKELFVIWYCCLFHHPWVTYSLLYILKKGNIYMSPSLSHILFGPPILVVVLCFISSSAFLSKKRISGRGRTSLTNTLHGQETSLSHWLLAACSLTDHSKPFTTEFFDSIRALWSFWRKCFFLGNPFYVDRKCTLFFFSQLSSATLRGEFSKKWIFALAFYNAKQFLISISI